ncbi:hypothetical protein RR46_02605 [Papilio xuthus]|uniref:Uncharacterized protein n=1 Tax=Papilio xuthus TaxID=66420 RepID=A0A194Q2C4_PAPXU|nr:hypothetical protein RR46_02605 [Papilio xuthus]
MGIRRPYETICPALCRGSVCAGEGMCNAAIEASSEKEVASLGSAHQRAGSAARRGASCEPRRAISAAHSIIMNEPHRNIPCLHPLARSQLAARRRRAPTAFYFFAVAHFAVIAISTRGIILGRMCASVHVDRFAAVERNPTNADARLAHTARSLIKGGVTRAPAPRLARVWRENAAIGRGDFYKVLGPRGLVYLFRRRRRGRGGRTGGIRAISKGGRNTAIFIRAAGMQSRSGAGVGAGAHAGRGAAAILRAALFIRFSRGVRRGRERGVR